MGKGQAILVTACVITIMLFGLLCYLMTTVNPSPLPVNQDTIKTEQLLDELIRATLGPERTDNVTNRSPLLTLQNSLGQDASGLLKDRKTEHHTSLSKSIQKVVPPVWPIKPKPPIIKTTVGSPENIALNETGKVGAESTPSTINDTLSVIKRSVNEVKQLGSDLNSIVLKIIDDSGQFNFEIKIGLNDGSVKKKNETREDKIQSKNKSKFTISLKTQDNNQFKKTKLAKNTIISVMPNDFVSVDEYDDNLEAKNKIKNNTIQANIVDFNNSAKCNIPHNKATVMPIFRDVLKPIVIFYNQTKYNYHSGTKIKKNEKRDLLEKPKDAIDGCKTNHNSFNTTNKAYNLIIQTERANKTAYNLTTHAEKGENKNENGDLLEKRNNASDGCQTNLNSFNTENNTAYNLTIQTEKGDIKFENGDLLEKTIDASKRDQARVNSSKTANSTAYNLTIQTEKGDNTNENEDLLQKPNDARDGCQTNLYSSNTAYNLTIQIEKGDINIENGDLLEKPNDARDGCQTNLNKSNTVNNTANNLTTQTEKGDKKTDKGDLLEKPNNARDGCQTNLNSSNIANNTAYNLTIQTEKGDIKIENVDLLEKFNDASDMRQTNSKNSNAANNSVSNLTIQTENGDIKIEKGNLLEKLNDASDRCQTNLKNFNAENNTACNLTVQTEKANNTAYNLTVQTEKANNTACNITVQTEKANNTAYNLKIQTEKTTLQYYVVTTRNENTTVEADNSTISTKTSDETSTISVEVNSTIPSANGNSIQNKTRNLIEMKEFVQSQNRIII